MKILVAEDDAMACQVLTATLSKWGYAVTAVHDGEAALRVMQEAEAPGIAILDWMMPGLDGPAVCRRLRSESSHASTYLILLTIRESKEDVIAGLRSGANDYVTKPFDPDELQARVGIGRTVVDLQIALATRVRELEAALTRGDRLESQRNESQARIATLAAIVESSDDAIVSETLDGVIRSWNAGAERLFGYTSHEVIGRSINLIIPPERQDEEQEILTRISRGDRVENFDTVRVSKQGRRIAISLTVSPVRDGEGRIVGASKVARDITDRKRAEDALREADRRKDQFIALLAHELRNPLAPLRNGLQVMRLAGGDANAVATARNMMERQLGHMVRLIDDLLDVARIGQSKMTLRRSRVLLTDVVSSAVETARPAIEAAGHQFILSLPPEPVQLDGDLTRLAQVFSNLLINSAKYTERGGHIWFTAERHGGEIVVSVRDTGIGIPSDALPRIFDMFSQVDRTTERSTGGLGIGLALVKGLVEMHDGTVTAASEGQGQGSIFTIRLPTLGGAAEPFGDAPSTGEQPITGFRRRILVADDNRDAADSMAEILKLMGNEVRAAHDGIEAVEAAGVFRPKVILMDLGMPRLNGYDAAQRIRQQPWGRDIIIIALTGWGQELDRAQSREAGCDGHLVKPVSMSDLENLLTELEVSATPGESGQRE